MASRDTHIRAPTVTRIRTLARRREHASRQLDHTISELGAQCLKARTEGITITQIARESGMSRQGVYNMLARAGGSSEADRTGIGTSG